MSVYRSTSISRVCSSLVALLGNYPVGHLPYLEGVTFAVSNVPNLAILPSRPRLHALVRGLAITREAKGWTVGFEIESVVSAESERTVRFALAMLTE